MFTAKKKKVNNQTVQHWYKFWQRVVLVIKPFKNILLALGGRTPWHCFKFWTMLPPAWLVFTVKKLFATAN